MASRSSFRGGGRGAGIAPWIGALVLVGLTLALGAALLPACGVDPGTPMLARWLDACPPPSAHAAGLRREAERAAVLRDRITRLERQLAFLPACPPSEPPPAMHRPEPPPSEPRSLEPPPPAMPPPEPPRRDPIPRDPPSAPPPSPPRESDFDRRLSEEGGEVSEELTVTLIWDDASDLDLQVVCPDGRTAGVAASGCGGGILDVDANGYGTGGLRMMDRPVENVRFGAVAPRGTYRIRIFIDSGYAFASGFGGSRNRGSHRFRVRVISRGQTRTWEGIHSGVGGSDAWIEFEH